MGHKIKSINFEELLYVMDNDEVFISECFYDYMDIYKDFLEHIGNSIQTGETSVILKTTEKFSRILLILSADRASDLALSIRFMSISGKMKSLDKVFDELCNECDRLRYIMMTYVNSIRANDPEKIMIKFESLVK